MGHRHAGSEGEREMLHQVKSRLPPGVSSRIEGFVAYTSPGLVVGVHAGALLAIGLFGLYWPSFATVACSLVTFSLIAEGTGRFSLFRWAMPKSASYNLVVRLPAEEPLGTFVVSTPLDVPRWRPDRPRWLRRPMAPVAYAAIVVTVLLLLSSLAEPWGRPTQGMYLAALAVLAAAVLLGVMSHRRSGGVRGEASGPAAMLELIRRMEAGRPPRLDLWAVFTGCGHAYQNGMHAFLAMHHRQLTDPVLVLALDEPGEQPLGAVVSEGPLWPQHHRPTGPALVERLRWAGVEIPEVDSATVTDASAALQWGYRAVALAGGDRAGNPRSTLRAVEVVEALLRLYAEDLARVPEVPAGAMQLPDSDLAPDPAAPPPSDGELVPLPDRHRVER